MENSFKILIILHDSLLLQIIQISNNFSYLNLKMARDDDDDDNEQKEDKEDKDDEDSQIGGFKKASLQKSFKKKSMKTLELKYRITLKAQNLKIYNYLTRAKLIGSRFQPKIKFVYKPSKILFGDLSLIPYNSKNSWLDLNATYQLLKQFKIKASIDNKRAGKLNFYYKNKINEQNITMKAQLTLQQKKEFSHSWSMQILKRINWNQNQGIFSKMTSDASFKLKDWKPELTLKTAGQMKQYKNKVFMELRSGIQKNVVEATLKSQLQIYDSSNIFGLTIKTIDKNGKIPIDFKYQCRSFQSWSFGINLKENLDYLLFVDKKIKGTICSLDLDKKNLSISVQRKSKLFNYWVVTGFEYPRMLFDGFAVKMQFNT